LNGWNCCFCCVHHDIWPSHKITPDSDLNSFSLDTGRPKLVLAQAKVVADLVQHRPPDLGPDLGRGAADVLDGPLKDDDLVGNGLAVGKAPVGLGHADVEAEEQVSGAEAGVGELPGRGPAPDDDGDVVQPAQDLLGQALDGFGHELLKVCAVGHGCIVAPKRRAGKAVVGVVVPVGARGFEPPASRTRRVQPRCLT
jgi:hypothetical protein